MPTGPGDDILDAIDAGTADKDILTKYKINDDQLKAFKTLHYGLSNQEMSYGEIKDYFPDLNTYFKGGTTPSPKKEATDVIEKPDFTKPVHEKQATESTAAPVPQTKYNQAAAESNKPLLSLQQKFNKKAEEGLQSVNKALHSNDDVLKSVIGDFKVRQAADQGYDKFAAAPRTDMPAASQLANVRSNMLPQEPRPEDQPITEEELQQSKDAIQSDPDKARQFINQVSVHKPDQAPELQSSMYIMDAGERLEKDPNIALKVNDNLNKLQKGELKYNAVTGQLTKELGPIDALISGVRERTRQMQNYDLFQGTDESVINLLEKRMKDYDPDKPVEMPKGFGEITQMLGMEWKTLLKGMATGAVTNAVGGEAATPYISAAINAPEYYKRGYSTAFEESYSDARKMGKTTEESLKIAQDQAKTEGNLGALEGGVSAFFGGRIGLKELPKFNITGGFTNAVTGLLKHSAHFAAETSIEGLADGITAGYLQGLKDNAAMDKGLFRDTEKNIWDNAKGELTFALAFGGMTKLGKTLISPETYKKIRYYLGNQNQEAVQSSLGNAVMTGQISKEDADNITKEIKEQKEVDDKIPEDIKDVSRIAMHDKIVERQALQQQLETTDEALHPEIKEKIKKLNEEILEHSKHKKESNDSETKAETQADAEADVKAEPGAPQETSQPEAAINNNKGAGETAPVADIASQDQTEQNAIPEQSAEGVNNPASSSDSAQVGEGNESQGPVNEKTTGKEKLEINSIEDLDKALQNLKQSNTEQLAGKEEQKVMSNRQPLPKLTESNQGSATPVNPDIKSYTPQSIIDKARETFKGDPLIERVANFLGPLIKANPNIKINHDADVPGHVYGYSHNNGSIDLNFKNHPNEGALLQTGLHEMVHAVTRSEIESNPAFRGEIDKALSKVRENMGLPDSDHGVNTAMHFLSAAGKLDESKYGAANAHELIAELFTNESFRDQLAGIKYEGDTLLKKIFQTIAKYLSEAYNKLVGAKQAIKADDLAEFLMQLTEKTVTGKQGEDTAGALGMAAPLSQDDAIRKIIKATPNSITDDQLKERIVTATGLDEQQVQDLIDEVRKPVVPPKPVIPTSLLTKEERQLLINQINNAINQPKPKEQSWISKQWEEIKKGMKDGSAWLDNPYRFITKIVEDINKHYGLANKEVIPLGRQFEKTSSGRAALKIYDFVNEIISGKINGEKLGRLTGEKYKDFQKYIFSKRVIDRLDKQEEQTRAGQVVNRQTGNISRQAAEVTLEELTKKYGNLDDFKKRGEAFQKHMDTMLQTLVASGIISKETYDKIKGDNNFYAPFSVVQAKLLAGQDKQPVGISGVVKRIKGIGYKLPTTQGEALTMINSLGDALNKKIISPEEYFNTSFQILNDAKSEGLITEEEYNQHIASLENPGFAINDILDAGANMIYKAEGMALKNTMLQRLYAYKASDTEGLFIQDVDGFKATTMPDGTTRMVPRPLNQIEVEPGMAPIKLRVDGKDKIVAVNKHAAEKLTQMSNYETASLLKTANFINKIFRATVITLSPAFQIKNFIVDLMRTLMLSRYGPLAGDSLPKSLANAALFAPQYIDALFHSFAGNMGYRTDTYKQWMNSDSFSKGMFDNLFDNEKRIKDISAPLAKRLINNFINLHWIEVPGSILEQTPKLMIHQRGLSVENFKPEMATAMLQTIINKNLQPNMTKDQILDGLDKVNYEVQNMAGSPNFTQTHKWMKLLSIYLQFFSARLKGEMTDYRRIGNVFLGKGEGVSLSKRETTQIAIQFASTALLIGGYAIRNIFKDEDEKEFDGILPWHQDNNINIPLGTFEYTDENDKTQTLREYAKIPLRGVTATMNVLANSFVKFYKRKNPEEFKKMAEAFLGNASPINLNGKDERELGESLASNLTPVFKYFVEYSFNRDTHNHRDIVPDFVTGKGMLSKYKQGKLKPWEVINKKTTPQWAIDMSKYLYETLDISISAIELDHMENTMGNPTELYDKAIKKNYFRSESKYPLYQPKENNKNTSSATVTPEGQ